MKITNRADYALHAMLYLASINGAHPATIDEIAEAENIPREYLAKILSELRRAGFIKPQHGRDGGYFLTQPRSETTFLGIIEAMDGPLDPSNCTKPEGKRIGHMKGKCPAYQQFDKIKRGLVRDLGAINLGEIPYEEFYPATKKKGK